MQFLLSFLHIFIRDFLTLFMHNNIVFWLSAQAKMIISPVVVWLHAGSGGKKFELHLTFGRTKSSVQEVIAAMVNKKDTKEKPQNHEKRLSHVCLFCCLSVLS